MTNEQAKDAAVIHRVTWDGDRPTFHCDGDQTSPCRNYPECDCDLWTDECRTAHPSVPQQSCWRMNWLKQDPLAYDDKGLGDNKPPHIDGPIETEWDTDCLLWFYTDSVGVSA